MSQPHLNYNQNTRVTPIRFELKTGLHITPPNQIKDKQLQILKNAAEWSRQHARIQRRLSSNERTHTRRDAPTIQYTPTNGHTYFHRGGGSTHNVTQRTDTHIFTGGGTHPQCNPTNRQTNFF